MTKRRRWFIFFLFLLAFGLAGLFLRYAVGKYQNANNPAASPPLKQSAELDEVQQAEADRRPQEEAERFAKDGVVFQKEELSQELKDRMQDVTISRESPVSFDELQALTLGYWGYDQRPHTGTLIVHESLADEVIQIFKELYLVQFPIEKMEPASFYGGDDIRSMTANNTSAFNDRPIEDSGGMSYHQLGAAIDVNPLVNPYIRFADHCVLPPDGEAYLDRTQDTQGMIHEDGDCVKIFKEHGWTWGGDWKSLKDYQHFEKDPE